MKHRGKVGIMVPRPVFRSLMVLPSELRRGRVVGDNVAAWGLQLLSVGQQSLD